MSKRTITLTIDEDILQSFDQEYENRSRRVEQFMDNAIINSDKREEIRKELESVREEKKELEHKMKLLNERLENLESQEKRKRNLEDFFTNEAEKFGRGHPKKWSSFEEFWTENGQGIKKKFENKGFDPERERLKEEIEKRIDD